MKKAAVLIFAILLSVCMVHTPAEAYNFGDFRSETLTTKAWGALAEEDLEAVLAYTNKCIELYGKQAKKMQDSLEDYPRGSNQEIFGYWALNDVATSLFIQGEAYRKAKMNDEAKEVYKKVIDEYRFGQAWDTKGWFWKPAAAAKEKIAMLESGSNLDFGDYTSAYLTTQAWKALTDQDTEAVHAYTDKVIELYRDKAKFMQESLTEYPWESKERIFEYWALNDVGTSLFIKAEAFKKSGKYEEARAAYQELVNNYSYAQCWDPNGWFWKPKEAAEQALDELGEI